MREYCVTGGTGLIGSYLVKSLLDKGYNVRTTVRNPEKLEKVGFLWELKGAKERLKILKGDVMEEGSMEEGFDGVDGVFHTASPVLVPYDHNIQKTLIDPSVKGTLNVLNSARKMMVKRVVLTSSCSCIRYRHDATQLSPLNESHWTDLDYCKRYNLWYAYAKTMAEQEAWKWADEQNGGIELVVVNLSFVVGPLLTPQPTSTLQLILAIVKGLIGEYPNKRVGFVHIEDAVRAHILAMEEQNASGRLICSTTVAHFSQIIHMLRAIYPSYPYLTKCSNEEGDESEHSLDCSKIMELGLPPFATLSQMFDDCIHSFQQKGFL
nr:tetraketide alpha-pyrone reductase 2-like [Ipomoea batatas]